MSRQGRDSVTSFVLQISQLHHRLDVRHRLAMYNSILELSGRYADPRAAGAQLPRLRVPALAWHAPAHCHRRRVILGQHRHQTFAASNRALLFRPPRHGLLGPYGSTGSHGSESERG